MYSILTNTFNCLGVLPIFNGLCSFTWLCLFKLIGSLLFLTNILFYLCMFFYYKNICKNKSTTLYGYFKSVIFSSLFTLLTVFDIFSGSVDYQFLIYCIFFLFIFFIFVRNTKTVLYLYICILSSVSFGSINSFMQLFIFFEVIFLLILTQPLICSESLSMESRRVFMLNIIKWNLPTTLVGLFYLNNFTKTTVIVDFSVYFVNNFNSYFYSFLILYFVLKISVAPFILFKYKLYSVINMHDLFIFNFNYFFIAQLFILPIFCLLKVSNVYIIFIYFIIYNTILLFNINKVSNVYEFIMWLSFTSYNNFMYMFLL